MHRELMFGSRTWDRLAPIMTVLETLQKKHGDHLIVIHGDHWQGADKLVNSACVAMGIQMIKIPAAWKGQKGNRAGPYRNGLMIEYGRPDHATGFRAPGKSNGTDNMYQKCQIAGVPAEVVRLE